ncbi:hypothetical protein AK37_15548 [Rhodococcus pyridinivorans AK37]|uniref:Uncharacterized protein n=1 Tax=Rhodococcus pyridinivorans AK37 TaxID=1114960 RepID=H0JTU0_9NOCA|nr:hypothetical protein AK37_15548 [Rhodococcus pyridinivorans AK37]
MKFLFLGDIYHNRYSAFSSAKEQHMQSVTDDYRTVGIETHHQLLLLNMGNAFVPPLEANTELLRKRAIYFLIFPNLNNESRLQIE